MVRQSVELSMTSVIFCCGVTAVENTGSQEPVWSGPCGREVPACMVRDIVFVCAVKNIFYVQP